jgi:hypothetical protein
VVSIAEMPDNRGFFTPAASVFLRATEKITNEQELRMTNLFTILDL